MSLIRFPDPDNVHLGPYVQLMAEFGVTGLQLHAFREPARDIVRYVLSGLVRQMTDEVHTSAVTAHGRWRRTLSMDTE